MKKLNKKGFFPIVITAGILLALALVLGVAFGGTALLIWFLSQNMLVLIGGALIVLSIIILKNINPWIVMIGGVMILLPFISDTVKDFAGTGFEIIPSQPGVSIITGEGRSHFEVGDSSMGVKLVGAIPSTGAGGGVTAYKLYFDNNLVACKDVSYGEWFWCACTQSTYKPQVIGCNGYQIGCDQVCGTNDQWDALKNIVDYKLNKDVHVTGMVCTQEHYGGHNPYDTNPCYSFDFIMPVYAPKTIERYILQDCQTDNPNSAGYCKGKCEANICNLETVIEKPIPIEQQEFISWKPIKNVCTRVTELGNKYFSTEQECKDNVFLVSQLSWWDKFLAWFKSLV